MILPPEAHALAQVLAPHFTNPTYQRFSALMVAAAPSGREGEGVHSLYATHLAILLEEAAPHLDAHFTAEALLATLAPAHHLRMRARYSLSQMVDGWAAVVQSLTRR